jgi:hypothetical protein
MEKEQSIFTYLLEWVESSIRSAVNLCKRRNFLMPGGKAKTRRQKYHYQTNAFIHYYAEIMCQKIAFGKQ